MTMSPVGRNRVALPIAIGCAIALILPAVASAHARVSPPVSLAGKLQLYSLAVPTEKSNLTTSKIVMTVPDGFGIDSFVPPPPGWHQSLQQTGSGDSAVITKVTWTGGKTPTGEDSLFQFLAQPASAKTYTFQVEQTYSDGSIVNWAGPESSAAPAPTIDATDLPRWWRRVGVDDHRADRRAAWPRRGRVRAGVQERREAEVARMSCRGRIVLTLAVVAVAIVLPSSASAHAYLIKTVPAASGILDVPPPNVQLTYDEAVEPRFAIISVTNAAGKQETTAPVNRSPANPDTLVVPLRPHLPEGWYLIYWRAISVDGHPVQGAFTYAVGPNPGPAPQFPVPSIAGSATSLNLLIARWVMFLSVMSAIGLFVFRVLIARPVQTRAPGTSVRTVSHAFVVASVIGLLAIPVYLDFATAIDSLRSVFDVTALVPLFRVTAFGRGYVDMMLCFALFCFTAWISLWLDPPQREHRSIAAIVSVTGALLAAGAVLLMPGAAGHAAQTSPRGISVLLDWLHLITGSIWLGG